MRDLIIWPDWAGDSTMKRNMHTPEQIIRKFKTAEQLISQGTTNNRGFQQCGGIQAAEAKRMPQLEKENARLNKLLVQA